ncbi:actin family [Amylocystis lapponica]|nr:actin family [Amylocystis lapponica]
MKPSTVVIVDNGGHTVKAGVLGVHDDRPRLIPNAIVRSKGDKTTYFGHELEKCRDFASLHYRLPFEKGYLVDWDTQKGVWDGMFSSEALGVNTAESSLLITEPYFNLPNIQDVYDQFVFEEYEFQSYYRCTPASLVPSSSLYKRPNLPPPDCMLVIDSGFSFTHVVPILEGSVVWSAVKRIDVGGKLLTNQLKELTSFRQWNMMEETYIINDVKESCCYVSMDYKRDLEACRADPHKNDIVQEYILPDFSVNRPGRVKVAGETLDDTFQVLRMSNERFTVPEIIFRPDDVGLDQSGIAATVAASIALLPEDIQGMFWAHIGLIGGNTKFPGFRERLISELRSFAPMDCEVQTYLSDDPIIEAYRSAVIFARMPDFAQRVVTRAEYLEMGSSACRRKFRDWKPAEREALRGREHAKGKGAARTKEADDDANSPPPAKKGSKAKGKGRMTVSRR